jgi:hypothetical protein
MRTDQVSDNDLSSTAENYSSEQLVPNQVRPVLTFENIKELLTWLNTYDIEWFC